MLFSAELPWCYFCAEIKVLGMTWKSMEHYSGIYNEYWKEDPHQGVPHMSTRVGVRLPPWAHPCLVGPLVLHRPQLQLYIFTSGEKQIREKDSSRFTIRSRRQALNSLGRADLESVRGSGEGNPSQSSSSTILHHQFHDAHRRA